MKKKTYRNKRYLDFVRGLPCAVSGLKWGIHAHHWRKGQDGGMGLKPSDTRCIPLAADLHGELHQIGEVSFKMKYHIEPELEMVDNMISYLHRLLEDFEPSEKVEILQEIIAYAEETIDARS